MSLRIISDSATDIPKDIAEDLGIEIIPTPVLIDGKDFFDGETITSVDFYDILRGDHVISTYHINSFMFTEHFEPYARRGDQVIYLCFSTGIAGTFNAATQARKDLLVKYPEFDLTIIDSKSASIGFGTLVLYAGLLLKNGAGKEAIVEATKYHVDHIRHVFTVETLEYLLKGGRIGKASAMAGEILSIKPVIQVNAQGALYVTEKVRGRKKSLGRLVQIVGEQASGFKSQVFGLVHGDDQQTMDSVREMLEREYGICFFMENFVGCAIGAHTGPGIIGITFMDTPSPYISERMLRSYFKK